MAYDDDAVYVGARLWESDPSRRVMSDMRRDAANLYNNDHFAVMIDTFYDRRNGYLFYANAQGGMADSQVANENANTDWNTIWETRSADFDGGWTIEFRIPFRSIRFQEGGRMWGINFRRNVRWKTNCLSSPPVPALYGSQRHQPGIRGRDAGRVGSARADPQHRRQSLRARFDAHQPHRHAADRERGDGDIGMDVKWAVTQSYIADLT